MRRGNLSIFVLLLTLFLSCSNTNQENQTSSISEETLENQAVVEVKEPANSIWISAKKGDIESIKQHIAFGTDLNSQGILVSIWVLQILLYTYQEKVLFCKNHLLLQWI